MISLLEQRRLSADISIFQTSLIPLFSPVLMLSLSILLVLAIDLVISILFIPLSCYSLVKRGVKGGKRAEDVDQAEHCGLNGVVGGRRATTGHCARRTLYEIPFDGSSSAPVRYAEWPMLSRRDGGRQWGAGRRCRRTRRGRQRLRDQVV